MKAFSYQRADSATQGAAAAVKPGAKIIVGGLALSQLLTLYTDACCLYLSRSAAELAVRAERANDSRARGAGARRMNFA